MTIAAALLCNEGLVLGADSATTLVRDGQVINISTARQKLLQLGMDRPYAIVTFGDAQFGSRSYRDLLAEFARRLGEENPPVVELAQQFLEFAKEAWSKEDARPGADPAPMPSTGILIGGCGGDDKRCSFVRLFLRPEGDEQELTHFDQPGQFEFAGCFVVADRLVFGTDLNIWSEIICRFVPDEKKQECLEALLGPHTWRMAPYAWMPLRDALDYVHLIIGATIRYYKFMPEPPICGGKIELACVTSDRGFRWVTHKSLDWNIDDVEGQTEYSPLDPHGHGR